MMALLAPAGHAVTRTRPVGKDFKVLLFPETIHVRNHKLCRQLARLIQERKEGWEVGEDRRFDCWLCQLISWLAARLPGCCSPAWRLECLRQESGCWRRRRRRTGDLETGLDSAPSQDHWDHQDWAGHHQCRQGPRVQTWSATRVWCSGWSRTLSSSSCCSQTQDHSQEARALSEALHPSSISPSHSKSETWNNFSQIIFWILMLLSDNQVVSRFYKEECWTDILMFLLYLWVKRKQISGPDLLACFQSSSDLCLCSTTLMINVNTSTSNVWSIFAYFHEFWVSCYIVPFNSANTETYSETVCSCSIFCSTQHQLWSTLNQIGSNVQCLVRDPFNKLSFT